MVYISNHRSRWPIAILCRVLGVSESGYYMHLRLQNKSDKNVIFLARIYELLKEDAENANYDCLKLNRNYIGSLITIYRICKKHNLKIYMQRKPHGNTKADAEPQKSENLIKQDFTAETPNKKWLPGITEIPCEDGKLYLSAILDYYEGTIRGFKMADNMQAGTKSIPKHQLLMRYLI